MIDEMPEAILFIEPDLPPSPEPVLDRYTRKMAAALRESESVNPTRGFHICSCGAPSSNVEHSIPMTPCYTNSLCVHYLAHHREEVPEEELRKVDELPFEEVDPIPDELWSPGWKPDPVSVQRRDRPYKVLDIEPTSPPRKIRFRKESS